MKTLFKIIVVAILGFGLNSCEKDVTVDDFFSGQADLSNYVAIGNSLTAGYQDGTLYTSGQANSYPAIIAQQMALVGGGIFTQPTTTDENGGLSLMGAQLPGFEPKLQLQVVGSSFAPVRVMAMPTTDVANNISTEGPFNNLGVPGAKSFHLLSPTYGSISGLSTMPVTANPFYVRFSKPNTSVIADAVAQNPSFFTLWIGNNDVLGFATSGGQGDVITPAANFSQFYGLITQSLVPTGADGVLANIPDVTDIPYFTTVPVTPIEMDATQAAAASGAYAAYNAGLANLVLASVITQAEADARTITFIEGSNPPVFTDNSLTTTALPKIRQVKSGELITLTALADLGNEAVPGDPTTIYGIGVPLDPAYVLRAADVASVAAATTSYNAAIASAAATNNWALADMNAFFKEIASSSGIQYNGVTSSVDFVTGGLFSLDGVHPTQRGYAVIANKFIEVINEHYSSNIPRVEPTAYPGVIFP